jgi:hypothetical protein
MQVEAYISNQEPRDLIASQGYLITSLSLPDVIREKVIQQNWGELDQTIALETMPGGVIFNELQKYAEFSKIEFIISIRSSREFPDEDGIWHDDGSRVLAFSLSLTLNHHEIGGGRLEIRKFGHPSHSEILPTPPYGSVIIFATGHQGFEHKINRVVQGERIIIAGWCT